MVATNVTAPTRTTSTPQHNSTPKRTPIANTYIKMMSTYCDQMSRHLVTAPVAKRDQTTAPSRTTSDTAIVRNTFTLTAHETSRLPGDRGHCHSISSHSATDQLRSLERQRHAATSTSPMTITHSPINKGGRLSNAASSLSQRPSRSATKQLRPLERRATSRLSERSSSLTYIP